MKNLLGIVIFTVSIALFLAAPELLAQVLL